MQLRVKTILGSTDMCMVSANGDEPVVAAVIQHFCTRRRTTALCWGLRKDQMAQKDSNWRGAERDSRTLTGIYMCVCVRYGVHNECRRNNFKTKRTIFLHICKFLKKVRQTRVFFSLHGFMIRNNKILKNKKHIIRRSGNWRYYVKNPSSAICPKEPPREY